MPDAIAYKVLTTDQFEQMRRDGYFHGAPVDIADGYIHMSSASQLGATIDKHFGNRTDLVLAAVNLAGLGDAVRWEPSRGGQLFPHLYGVLPMEAVVAFGPMERTVDGSVKLPG